MVIDATSKYPAYVYLAEPRALRRPDSREERKAQLDAPHIVSLESFAREVEDLESTRRGEQVYIPHFDPGDAGIDARILAVYEAPGPMTNGNSRGSGFISVDNDDRTAENTWKLRTEAGATWGVLHWNIVPWFLGEASVKPRVEEVHCGAEALCGVIDRLPRLSTVLLCGRFAQRGWERFVQSKYRERYRVIETWHPSPLSLRVPERSAHSLQTWKSAMEEETDVVQLFRLA